MEIMKSCYKCMLIIGICAPIDFTKTQIVHGFVRSITIFLLICVCVFQPCLRYFLQHISNLVDATGVGLMFSIGICAAVSLMSFTICQKQILKTIIELQSIVQKRTWNVFLFICTKCNHIKGFYFCLDSVGSSTDIFTNAEQQSEWYTKRIVGLFLGFVWTLVLVASIGISAVLARNGSGPQEWMLPYKAMYWYLHFFRIHFWKRMNQGQKLNLFNLLQISDSTNYIRPLLYSINARNARWFRDFNLCCFYINVFCIGLHIFNWIRTKLWSSTRSNWCNGFDRTCKSNRLQSENHTNCSIS